MKKSTWVYLLLLVFTICMVFYYINILVSILPDVTSEEEIVNGFKDNKIFFVETANYLLNNDKKEIFVESFDEADKNLTVIFNKLSYKSMHNVDNSFVYFVRDSGFEFGQGIIYSVNGNEPNDHFIYKLTRLDENWFLFKSE